MDIQEKNENLQSSNVSMKYGILAGFLMAMVYLIFQLTASQPYFAAQFLPYAIMVLVQILAFNIYRQKTHDHKIFIHGISLGARLNMFAAFTVVLISVLLFLINRDLSFDKYGIEPSGIRNVALIAGILLFETFAFGMIITFAILQYLKERVKL